jgi:hypothetical protein
MFIECFAKVLNHLFQLVGITSTQRLRDKDFNSVLQAAVRRGHTYLISNVKRISLRSSSEKESSFVPETEIDMVSSTGFGTLLYHAFPRNEISFAFTLALFAAQ